MYGGWAQVAFLEQLDQPVTAVDVEGHRLVAVSDAARTGVFDATCPHRGAHLGHGGTIDGAVVVCPFHGHRISLGRGSGPLSVAEHPSVWAAGGVFVLLGTGRSSSGSPPEGGDTGLADRLRALEASHHVRPAFETDLAVPAPYVIENAVDADHFAAVHELTARPRLRGEGTPEGAFAIDGEFEMVRANVWQRGTGHDADGGGDGGPEGPARSRFSARIYSPFVVVSELGEPEVANVVVTAATPTGPRSCRVRVTVALPRSRPGSPATVREVASLVSGSRTAFDQDRAVWEHLDLDATPTWLPGDELVEAFHAFCARFELR